MEITKLIKEAKNELILIVPYIKTSENIFEALQVADSNDVDIILIYRENKLTSKEKAKLLQLNNLTLLHHPNIHCKTYFNGELLIIGSMNLYEYSEKNNREMGVLFHSNDIDSSENTGSSIIADSYTLFDDAKIEMKEIISSAEIERTTEYIKEKYFKVDVLKSFSEIQRDQCEKLNKYFLNKRFIPFETYPDNWLPKCSNYFDDIDVYLDNHRTVIKLNIDPMLHIYMFDEWNEKVGVYDFPNFKCWWNIPDQGILLYWDQDYMPKAEAQKNEEMYYNKIKEALDAVIKRYRILRQVVSSY